MFYLPIRILLYDKQKTLIALLGVVFAVSLIFTQIGIWIGMVESSSAIIDHTPGDIWVTSKNNRNFDFSSPIPQEFYYRVLSVPGIQWADKLIVSWGVIKEPQGGFEQIELIGYNPETGVGGPWEMAEGRADQVKNGNFAIVDESAMKKLGYVKVGEYREVLGRRLQITGISRGARSFTTAPFVFTSYALGQELGGWVGPDKTSFIVAKAAPGHKISEVVESLRQKLQGVDVYSKDGFSRKTRAYWTFQTGVGFSFLLTIGISFFIGMLIVGQTLYNWTQEYVKEYGTLMALGAGNLDLYKIVFSLAVLSALLGFPISLAITLLSAKLFLSIGMVMVIKAGLVLFMFALSMLMCVSSALASINKIKHIDPAVLFVG